MAPSIQAPTATVRPATQVAGKTWGDLDGQADLAGTHAPVQFSIVLDGRALD